RGRQPERRQKPQRGPRRRELSPARCVTRRRGKANPKTFIQTRHRFILRLNKKKDLPAAAVLGTVSAHWIRLMVGLAAELPQIVWASSSRNSARDFPRSTGSR